MNDIILDPWQKEYINYKGHKVLASGRQTGKSEAAAIDNAEFAVNNPNTTSLIISKTERQAEELLLKTLLYVGNHYKNLIKKGKDKPTKHKFTLTNNSVVISLPVGIGGEGVRYLTIHKLTVDEAQLPPDEVYTAVTPMLLTTGGFMSLLGTPKGKRGYFYEAYKNELNQFKVFHINSIDVINNRPLSQTWPEWRREAAVAHLKQEKERMTPKHFTQEYLGEFVEDLFQFYSDDLIESVAIIDKSQPPVPKGNTYLGVDVARQGKDESVFTSVYKDNDKIKMFGMKITKKTLLPDTVQEILDLDSKNNYSKIFIDTGGLGVGVYDPLLRHDQTKRKVVSIDNASRALERDTTTFKPRKKHLLKEDLYVNLLELMQTGKIKIFNDRNLKMSLRSIQYEYTEDGNMKIYGDYTHCTESLIRAAWCVKDKSLNIWIR